MASHVGGMGTGNTATPMIARLGRFVTASLLAVALASFIVGLFRPEKLFICLGSLSLVAVIWPVHRMRAAKEMLSTWGFLVASVFMGIAVRTAYIAFELADQRLLDSLFLRGEQPTYFLLPGALLVFSLFLVSVSYTSVPPGRVQASRLARSLSQLTIDGKSLHVVVIVLALISFGAFLIFAEETGGLDLLEPSRQRATAPGLEVGPEYRGLGYLRFLASLGATGYLALLTYYATSSQRINLGRAVLLGVAFISACSLPFYASARTEIVWLVLLSGVVLAYGGRRLRSKDVLA
jgi:hypothetical protein